MFETFMGLAAGFLGILLGELRRRRGVRVDSVNPPPPGVEACKKCFFFREFSRGSSRMTIDLGDTQLIRRYRFDDLPKERM